VKAERLTFQVEGIVTALLTPLDSDGEVKEDALRALIDYQLANGIRGFFPLGTSGEGMKLPLATRKRAAEIVVSQTGGKVPVIVHVGTQDTGMTVDLAVHAADIGADALGAVGPFFYRPDTLGLIQHYRLVGETADTPLFVYNIPDNQGYNISPQRFGAIAAGVPQIAGIKDTSRRIDQLQSLVHTFGGQYTVIGASDALIFANFAAGASAHISMLSNVYPRLAVQIYEAIQRGRLEEARQLQFQAMDLRDVFRAGPSITPYKEALKMKGLDVGTVSSPLRVMTNSEVAALRSGLQALGRLEPIP
jgi:dihydrodipicolinate synthase/N-acetylneuraminate lyase